MLGLAALDATLVVGDRHIRLATDEWAGGVVDPVGYRDIESFSLADGVPRWRWVIGDVVLEREIAMVHGRPAVAVRHRLVRASSPVRIEITPLCTWRDGHSDRRAGADPWVETTSDGFVFEHAYRVRGPNGRPADRGTGVRARAETNDLSDTEDLWAAGTFVATLSPGGSADVVAWAGDLNQAPPGAAEIVASAGRAGRIRRPRASDDVGDPRSRRGSVHRLDGNRPLGRGRLPMVRRVVARHDDLVPGCSAAGRHEEGATCCGRRRRCRKACSRTQPMRVASIQHRGRHAGSSAVGRRGDHRRPRHPREANGSLDGIINALARRGSASRSTRAMACSARRAWMGTHVDERGSTGTRHARRQGRRDQRALDQRVGHGHRSGSAARPPRALAVALRLRAGRSKASLW